MIIVTCCEGEQHELAQAIHQVQISMFAHKVPHHSHYK